MNAIKTEMANTVNTIQNSNDPTCRPQENRSAPYATKEDFCRIFSEEMKSLYLLSLLLTADHKEAEQCFVAGIEECSAGRPVFRQWAHSWTRRIVIQAAIRLISPIERRTRESGVRVTAVAARCLERDVLLLGITQLPSFERFAFVMSTLERYSDKDCCVLLECSRRELITARDNALGLLQAFYARELPRSERDQLLKTTA